MYLNWLILMAGWLDDWMADILACRDNNMLANLRMFARTRKMTPHRDLGYISSQIPRCIVKLSIHNVTQISADKSDRRRFSVRQSIHKLYSLNPFPTTSFFSQRSTNNEANTFSPLLVSIQAG